MNSRYLIYVCRGIESVFDSQVLELLDSLIENQSFEKVYLFLGIRNKSEMKEFKKQEIPKALVVELFQTYPNYSFFNILSRKALLKVIKRNSSIIKESVFHIREELLAWHISKVYRGINERILPNIRGATLEELSENRNLLFYAKYFKIQNYKRALENLKVLRL